MLKFIFHVYFFSGWRVSEKSACPNEEAECQLPLKAECSFKGCEPLDMHDESFYDVYDDFKGRALREDIYTVECKSEEGSKFVLPTYGSLLLAKDNREFEDLFLTAVFEGKDIEVELSPHLKIICTHHQIWEFDSPKIM